MLEGIAESLLKISFLTVDAGVSITCAFNFRRATYVGRHCRKLIEDILPHCGCRRDTSSEKFSVISFKIVFLMQVASCSLRFLSSLLWVQMYRLGVAADTLAMYQPIDFEGRIATFGLTHDRSSPSHTLSISDDILGGSIYSPSTFPSLQYADEPYFTSEHSRNATSETMSDSRERKTRWKRKNACEIAQGDPISAMYETMKKWGAPYGLFVDSAVLLQVDGQQAQLLSRACFGRPYPPSAVQLLSPASSYPPPVPDEGIQLIQLGLEEAFFLTYELTCIEIYEQTPQGKIKLSPEDLWRLMERSKKQFMQYYKAYSHLRSKRWVVLSGIQYGADFMAYRHHPALVHSDYAVLVMVGEGKNQERLSTWTDLHAMQRLCGSVAKTILLLHVSPKGGQGVAQFPLCLEGYTVEAVEVERWIPEKHRETIGSPDMS